MAKVGEQSKKNWIAADIGSVSKPGGQIQRPLEGRSKEGLVGGQRMRMQLWKGGGRDFQALEYSAHFPRHEYAQLIQKTKQNSGWLDEVNRMLGQLKR